MILSILFTLTSCGVQQIPKDENLGRLAENLETNLSDNTQKPVITLKDSVQGGYIETESHGCFKASGVISVYAILSSLYNVINIDHFEIAYPSHYILADLFNKAGLIEGFGEDYTDIYPYDSAIYPYGPDPTNTYWAYRGDMEGMTRAGFIKMMFLINNMEYSQSKSSFSDVAGHWAEEYIAEFEKHGYINLKGYPDGRFRPDDYLTKAEFISIINRMINVIPNEYIPILDNHPDYWAYEDIKSAVFNINPGPYTGAGIEYEQEYKQYEGYIPPNIKDIQIEAIDSAKGIYRLTIAEFIADPNAHPFFWWQTLYAGTFSECTEDFRSVKFTMNPGWYSAKIEVYMGDSMGRCAMQKISLSIDDE